MTVSRLRPTSREVHSWSVSLYVPPETFAGLWATLTPDEQDRSARFRSQRDRRRFIVARGVLREILGHYLEIDPARVHFVYNRFGKPDLDPEFGGRLRFNLSHSADLALIAIATGPEIGVDLEPTRAHSCYLEMAQRFFSMSELDALNGLPSQLHALAFLGCWTRKEAYMKARGGGLAIPPTSFSVHHLQGAWSFHTLHPAPGYVGAVAIEGEGWYLRQLHWRPASTSTVTATAPFVRG
jgi:4'-phosphopantetheinyl transferase